MDFDYSEFYNRDAGANPALTVLASRRYVEILRPYLPASKTAKILEIGPGNGLTLQYLGEMGYTGASGLEIDKNLAEAAKAKGLNVEHIAADAVQARLEAQKNSFDLVFCMHVIEHVPKDQQIAFIRAAGECLTAHGYLVCETPNALSATANFFRYGDWTHTTIFTPASLGFLYQAGGLTILYAGASTQRTAPERGEGAVGILKRLAAQMLQILSHGISRIHYVAEFGLPGFAIPLTSSLLVVGQRRAG